MSANLLEALQIFTKLAVDTVGKNLAVLSIDNIALSVEEPRWDFVLSWVLNDCDDSLELFGGEFTSAGNVSRVEAAPATILPLVQVDIGLLADQVAVSATDTLDLGQGVHDLLLSIDVGVEKTQDELEVRLLAGNQRHLCGIDVLCS